MLQTANVAPCEREREAIPVTFVRFPSDQRKLFRQHAMRKAVELGMTVKEWKRKRREAISPLAADILMTLWTPGRTMAGEPAPHPFA